MVLIKRRMVVKGIQQGSIYRFEEEEHCQTTCSKANIDPIHCKGWLSNFLRLKNEDLNLEATHHGLVICVG